MADDAINSYRLLSGPLSPAQLVPGSSLGEALATTANGKVIAITAARGGANGDGETYLFKKTAKNTWALAQLIPAPRGFSAIFSPALSGSGKVLVVGAGGSQTVNGAVFIYHWSAGQKQWVLVQTLQPAEIVPGDLYGQSVSISADGKTLAVANQGFNSGDGRVWVFAASSKGAFVLKAKLDPPAGVTGAHLGESVAISRDGKTIVAGVSGLLVTRTEAGFGWDLMALSMLPATHVSNRPTASTTSKAPSSPTSCPRPRCGRRLVTPCSSRAPPDFTFFGTNIATDDKGMYMATSTPVFNAGKGGAWFYKWNKAANSWTLITKITPAATDSYGNAVAMSWDAKYAGV